ncbi:hypothetical protein HPB48_014988 [Haemaphysalis longicornis]|uniref:Uncharacterized protein n=1 Tax=Haemaphysalis longicornis TaxID=44386 RepID=A0A9J6FI86_HAELO|nr:hypothetical protein HPB48_014988 [Haemaphysalis longicornis]
MYKWRSKNREPRGARGWRSEAALSREGGEYSGNEAKRTKIGAKKRLLSRVRPSWFTPRWANVSEATFCASEDCGKAPLGSDCARDLESPPDVFRLPRR